MTDGQMPTGEMMETVVDPKGSTPITTLSEGDGAIGAQSVGEAAQSGMDAAKQVQHLGFAEFTASLINGTFDAVVGATIKQMDAYAKLVADLKKSVEQFKTENISDAEISQYLAERYPDGEGGTCIRPNYTFKGVPADAVTGVEEKKASDQLKEVVQSLEAETRELNENAKITAQNFGLTAAATSFNIGQVQKIRTAIGYLLAEGMISHLERLAQLGMARIVVTDGEISSKLTFSISTTDFKEKQQKQYNQNLNRTQVGAGGNGFWWKVKASTDNTNLNVNSMNEKSFDSTLMKAEMIGEVKIRFKTESFPPYQIETRRQTLSGNPPQTSPEI